MSVEDNSRRISVTISPPAPPAAAEPKPDPVRIWIESKLGHVVGAQDALRAYDEQKRIARETEQNALNRLVDLTRRFGASLGLELPPGLR